MVSKSFDQVLCKNENDRRPESKTVTTTMSIGLISKKFWSKFSQFHYTYQNLTKEVSQKPLIAILFWFVKSGLLLPFLFYIKYSF